MSTAAQALEHKLERHMGDADRILLYLFLGHFPLVMAFTYGQGTWLTGLVGAALTIGAAIAGYLTLRNSRALRVINALVFAVFSALLIQVQQGRIELHFHIFGAMAFLLIYRDWLPIAVFAGAIAVHHALFNVLQEMEATLGGMPVIIFSYGCGWDIVALHAFFVVFEAAILIYFAQRLWTEFKDEVDLTHRIQQNNDRMLTTFQALDSLSGEIRSYFGNIQQMAQEMKSSASQQASAVEQTAVSLDEIARMITGNAHNAHRTNDLASFVAEKAQKGGEAMETAVGAVSEITKKINVIDDIAAETHLLSVNAAIESARAGKHGQGFVVIASEVRKLAELSQESAKTILSLSRDTSQSATNAGFIMDEMLPSLQQTATQVAEITRSSQEQNSGVREINKAIKNLSETAQDTAQASDDLSTTANQMQKMADLLVSIMYELKQELDD